MGNSVKRDHEPGRTGRRRKSFPSRGFTMVELLVVVSVFALVLALLIPAVLSARAAARRSQCQSNLRSIGQAILAFESGNGRLPAGRDQQNMGEHSWATRILPYIEEQALYDQYNWKRSWRDMEGDLWQHPWEREFIDGSRVVHGNLAVATNDVPVFICPATSHDYKGAIDYGGNYGTSMTGENLGFMPGQAWDSGLLVSVNIAYTTGSRRQGIHLSQVIDGISHTVLVYEDAGREPQRGGMWANGHNCFAPQLAAINMNRENEIYSDHYQIAHALLADGSVLTLTHETDSDVIGAISTRAGLETAWESIQ